MAAVYAVDPNPSHLFLVLTFLWLFFWEVGGQNIPNDWADIEEDTALKASTLPVRFGPAFTVRVILICLVLTVCLGCMTIAFSHLPNLWAYTAASVGVGFYFLLLPALNLYITRDRTLLWRFSTGLPITLRSCSPVSSWPPCYNLFRKDVHMKEIGNERLVAQ